MLHALLVPLLSLQLLCDTSTPAANLAAPGLVSGQGLDLEIAGQIVRVHTLHAHTDTVIAVRRGTGLELRNFAGVINVNGWNRDAVRLQADHGRRDRIVWVIKDKTMQVDVENERGMPTDVNYNLTVPHWMSLDLSGVATSIAVTNVKAKVTAETVSGDVFVRGAGGELDLSSIEGQVQVTDASAGVQASSVNNDVRLLRIAGDVSAESVNGTICLEQLVSPSVEASSMSGNVFFVGDFMRNGHYELTSHTGNVLVGVPEDADLDISVTNFMGAFRSGFPLKAMPQARRGREFSFTLGNGESSLSLESYQGLIQLLRPLDLKVRIPRLAPLAPQSRPAPATAPTPVAPPEPPSHR